MFDPIWSIVIASAIVVIGGIIVYKQMVARLAECSSEEEFLARRQQALSSSAVRFLVIELVLSPFLIYGIYHIIVLGMVESPDVTLPLMVVLLTALFGTLSLYFTTSQITRDPNASDKMKAMTTPIMIIWIGLINSFPVMSFALLLGIMLDLWHHP